MKTPSATLLAALLCACGQPSSPPAAALQTRQEYAKAPDGCEAKPPQWYADTVKTDAGIKTLKDQSTVYLMRSEYHATVAGMTTISSAERNDHIHKGTVCATEAKWALETLAKAGITKI